MWGEAFNLSSLAGMFFAGKTGLAAAMHHAPIVDGKERYVFYALPHIAVDADGKVPDLLELTRITQAAIQTDLENTIKKVVNTNKSDYAVITGIQIHGPEVNYVWPAECYAVVNGNKIQLKVE